MTDFNPRAGPNAGAREDELDALYGDVGAGLGGDGEQNANNRASLEDAYQAYEPNQARVSLWVMPGDRGMLLLTVFFCAFPFAEERRKWTRADRTSCKQ